MIHFNGFLLTSTFLSVGLFLLSFIDELLLLLKNYLYSNGLGTIILWPRVLIYGDVPSSGVGAFRIQIFSQDLIFARALWPFLETLARNCSHHRQCYWLTDVHGVWCRVARWAAFPRSLLSLSHILWFYSQFGFENPQSSADRFSHV